MCGWIFLSTKRRGKLLILKNRSEESERYYLNNFLVCFFLLDSFHRQIKTKNKPEIFFLNDIFCLFLYVLKKLHDRFTYAG